VDVPKVPDATATPSSPVAHDDVQEISNEPLSSACGRMESPVQNVVAHAVVQYVSPSAQTPVRSFPADMEGLAQSTIVTQGVGLNVVSTDNALITTSDM